MLGLAAVSSQLVLSGVQRRSTPSYELKITKKRARAGLNSFTVFLEAFNEGLHPPLSHARKQVW